MLEYATTACLLCLECRDLSVHTKNKLPKLLEVAGASNENANEQAADHSELTQTQYSDMEKSHYEDIEQTLEESYLDVMKGSTETVTIRKKSTEQKVSYMSH